MTLAPLEWVLTPEKDLNGICPHGNIVFCIKENRLKDGSSIYVLTSDYTKNLEHTFGSILDAKMAAWKLYKLYVDKYFK